MQFFQAQQFAAAAAAASGSVCLLQALAEKLIHLVMYIIIHTCMFIFSTVIVSFF